LIFSKHSCPVKIFRAAPFDQPTTLYTFYFPHLKVRRLAKVRILTHSGLSDTDMQRLCTLDSITQSLFKAILRGVDRNPMEGKRKEGIKAL